MRVTLIYPPSDNRSSECFTVPNASIATLAGALKAAGHEALCVDLDIIFHKKLKREHPELDFSVLGDSGRVRDYVSGRLRGKAARALRGIEDALLGAQRIERSDLYGITLADMTTNRFLVNAAALIAHGLKRRGPAPVVIGYDLVPRHAYHEIMKDYPVFDYAAYEAGEASLLRLMRHIAGKGEQRGCVIERTAGALIEHDMESPRGARCTSSDYRTYPLDLYRVGAEELFSRYRTDRRFTEKMRGGVPEQLIVPYRFENTCRGRCIFCGNESGKKSDRRSINEVLDDLHGFKELGATGVYFLNPNFNNTYRFAEELCEKMIRQKLDLLWFDCANLREMDESLLGKMKEAGAVKLAFGMETGSARLLKFNRKGTSRDSIGRFLRHSHFLGIWNHIELIGGLPTETDADIEETVEFLGTNAGCIDTHSLNPFHLFRRSPLYQTPERFGIRLCDEQRLSDESDEDLDHFSADEKVGVFSERFDEVGGLSWPEKDAQIRESTRKLGEAIEKISPASVIDMEHVHLLMFLYRKFGHSRKEMIRRIIRTISRQAKPYNLDMFVKSDFRKWDLGRVLERKPVKEADRMRGPRLKPAAK